MKFGKVYPYLIAKAERKGRSKEEVYAVTTWLTGYSAEELDAMMSSETTYGSFLDNAPEMNPDRERVKGSICGVKIEEIADTRTKDMRILDKLVDELAKGKPIAKIIGNQK